MPQVNLSTLNGRELRQLLDASRRRGDASLSYSVLQEMAQRRGGHSAQRAAGIQTSAEARLVAVDLGDPMEPSDELPPMPGWRPPPHPAEDAVADTDPPPVDGLLPDAEPDVERMAPLEADRPLSLRVEEPWQGDRDDPEPADLRPRPAPRDRARRGVSFPIFAAFTVGIGLGTGFGWLAGGIARDVLPEPPAAAAPMRTAALAPEPTPPPAPVISDPAPQVEPAPAAPLDAASQPEAQDTAPVAGEVEEPTAEAAPAAPPITAACATEPTPADRAICGDPKLQALQRELRQAYAEAIDAHQDRDLLRQRQLAWADSRKAVSDPERLAALYEQRIRKLNAATAEARRQH